MLTSKKKKYFKKLIFQMLNEVAAEDCKSVNKDIVFKVRPLDFSDRAKSETESILLLRMKERQSGLIGKIDEALKRIENGTYGTCMECEKEISEIRLKARPVATLCIKCKRKQERFENVDRAASGDRKGV